MKGQWSQNFQFLAHNLLKIAAQRKEKSRFLGLCNSLLMGLGQDQQKYTAVHTVGVSRGRVFGSGCWRQ